MAKRDAPAVVEDFDQTGIIVIVVAQGDRWPGRVGSAPADRGDITLRVPGDGRPRFPPSARRKEGHDPAEATPLEAIVGAVAESPGSLLDRTCAPDTIRLEATSTRTGHPKSQHERGGSALRRA